MTLTHYDVTRMGNAVQHEAASYNVGALRAIIKQHEFLSLKHEL